VAPSEVLHVFAGYKYDMFPASELGMKTVWINRKDDPLAGDAVPDYVKKGLRAVPDLLGL
jgi:FMN phosphatase YigB (HAD superfamily)